MVNAFFVYEKVLRSINEKTIRDLDSNAKIRHDYWR